MYIVASPKFAFASLEAICRFSSNSSNRRTIRIPFPPPPLAALIITGNPQSSATLQAISSLRIAPSEPGVTGSPAFFAVSRAFTLSPTREMVSGFGPIHTRPAFSTSAANSALSDKKPTPG